MRHGGPSASISQMDPRQVMMQGAPIESRSIPTVQNASFTQNQVRIGGGIAWMDAISDNGTVDACGTTMAGETDPQVPVCQIHQPRIPAAGRSQGVGSDDHVR